MDETEVTNGMYIEYLFWLKNIYGGDSELRRIYIAALPDTLVWRNPLGFNEDMVNNYLRHPAFQNHPVVGVSWNQANNLYLNLFRVDKLDLGLSENYYLVVFIFLLLTLISGYLKKYTFFEYVFKNEILKIFISAIALGLSFLFINTQNTFIYFQF